MKRIKRIKQFQKNKNRMCNFQTREILDLSNRWCKGKKKRERGKRKRSKNQQKV